MNKIEEASIKIGIILKDLEENTGDLVDSISVESVEITNISSIRQEYKLRVRIDMTRRTGHQW